MLRGVKSFSKGPTSGPSGLRSSHLREAVECPEQLLSVLTSFVNLLSAGQSPTSVTPHLCGATLLAIQKRMEVIGPLLLVKCYVG